MRPALARFVAHSVDRLRGWSYADYLAELERTQWLPPDALRELRASRLRALLTHCENHNGFYSATWKALGIRASEITDERDLEALPVISKDDLRAHAAELVSRQGPPYDVWKSSGSTGRPFAFQLSKRSAAVNTFAALARGKRWWGFEVGQPEGMIWSGVTDISGTWRGRLQARKRRVSWGLKNVVLVDVYGLNDDRIREGYEAFRRHRPRSLRTIATGLLRFCQGIETMGLDGRALGLEGAIFTGEGLSSNQRAFIEKVLGCPTICEYGCTELGTLGFECPAGSVHMGHDHLLIEYLTDGRAARPGELADIVVTNLQELAFPLIRYKVGDLVVPSEERCSCGRTLPIVSEIGGRSHDVVLASDGSVIHGLFFTHLFDDVSSVHQFRVVQESLTHLRLQLVGTNIAPGTIDGLKKKIGERLGPRAVVDAEVVTHLPTAARGKTPWIISHVAAQDREEGSTAE